MKKVLCIGLFFIIVLILAVKPVFSSVYQKIKPLTTLKKTTPKKKSDKMIYTCNKHPEIIMFMEGKCPICNKDLVEKSVSKIIYICPIHKSVESYKEGKCPKCGMPLVKSVPMNVSV